MAIKKIITTIISFILIATLVGCDNKEQNETNNSITDNNIGINDVIISSKNPSQGDAIGVTEWLWEKEKEELNISSLKIGANWFDEITIGETKISSTTMTDVSLLPNYFFSEKDDPSKIEIAYYDPHYAIAINTAKIRLGNNSSFSMRIASTTYEHNLMIESVQIAGVTNICEDNGTELKGLVDNNGSKRFGFGNTYAHVFNLIGKPDNTITDSSGDFNLTTAFYNHKNASMTLTFSYAKDGKIEDGALTSIYWKPLEVCSILHNQDNIHSFKGAPDISQPELENAEEGKGTN